MGGCIGCIVKLNLSSGKYYKGKVLNETETHIEICDINGKNVEIAKSMIMIKEVLN
jgi:hypothetical protein